jgi:membrane-bound ClpP family serine protease
MRLLLLILTLLIAAGAVAQSPDTAASPIPGAGGRVTAETNASETPADSGDEGPDQIYVCNIKGPVDEGVKVLVQRAVQEANANEAAAIFFRIDTPGGRVDSAIEITKAIETAKLPTVAYIEGMGAISAGALISFACDTIVMTPGTNMGAATPVMMTPEGATPLGEKEVSFLRAKMRALAESNGHNPDIAQAMVDKDIELRAYTNEQGEYVVFASNTTEILADADDSEDRFRHAAPQRRSRSGQREAAHRYPQRSREVRHHIRHGRKFRRSRRPPGIHHVRHH